MKTGLKPNELREILDHIKKHLGGTKNPKIYLYGSRVIGNFREFSDVDLLLCADEYDEKSLSMIDFNETDTPYKIDFVLDKDLFEKYRDEIYEHMVEVG
jgi:predicted nucleotidyltransferase